MFSLSFHLNSNNYRLMQLTDYREDDAFAVETAQQQQGPSEEQIAEIMSMGFDQEQALNALAINGNNLERAVNYLLSSM